MIAENCVFTYPVLTVHKFVDHKYFYYANFPTCFGLLN